MLSVSMRVTASNTSRSKTNDNDDDDSSSYKSNNNNKQTNKNTNYIMTRRDTPTHSPPLSATRAAWCQGQAVPQSAAP